MGLKIGGNSVKPNSDEEAQTALSHWLEDDPAPATPKKDSKKDAKKEKSKPPISSDLSTILAAVRKDVGEHTVVTGNTTPPVQRQPTGIFELDFYLGGGFPKGRYSIVYGPESSTKSNIAFLAIAQAQKAPGPNNKAVLFNIEQTYDPPWAQILGVDTENLIVVNPAYGEQAVDILDAIMRAEDVSIVVVDSVAALISSKEIANSTEQYDIGTSALLIKRMVNKMMIAFGEEAKRGHYPCVILINQTRFKPGVMFGSPETMPGGEAQKFLSSLRIRTSASNVIDPKTNLTTFKAVDVTVKKAKIPIRAMSFKFNLCVSPSDGLSPGETNSFNMVKGYLQALGLLNKGPKGYVIAGLAGTWSTLSEIQEQYRADSEFCAALQKMVNDAMTETTLVEEEQQGPAKALPGNPYAKSGGTQE